MCMKRMYVNICLGGSLGTMMHMWNEWTDNLGFDPHHHLLDRVSLSSAAA